MVKYVYRLLFVEQRRIDVDNFKVAAERIFNDMELLFKEKRWFNSCYFAGYVTECYMKIILSQIMGKTPDEVKEFSHSLYRLNIELKDLYSSFINGGLIPPNYICDLNIVCPTIKFGGQKWHPEKRYSDGIGEWEESTAIKYNYEANEIMLKIIQMQIDGVI